MDKVRLAIDIFILAVVIGYAIARIREGRRKSAKFSTVRKPRVLDIECWQFARDVFKGRRREEG